MSGPRGPFPSGGSPALDATEPRPHSGRERPADRGGQQPAAATTLLPEREALVAATIDLEPTGRVPIVYQAEAFSPRFMGYSIADYALKPDVAVASTLGAMDRLGGFDAINSVPGGHIHVGLAALWLTRMLVPGRELPEDSIWQADEVEDMTAADYDVVLEGGWGPYVQSLLPRILDIDELARSDAWLEANFGATVARFRDHGYVPMAAAVIATPFEALCGARSIHELYRDLYRCPDLVARVMDRMLPEIVDDAVAAAQACELPCVWVGGWRSASGMLSEPVWQRFVLPHLRTIVDALVEAGFLPILHFDHDWTRDLKHLRGLPARRCILQLDGMTDIRAAKRTLGDHMALMGDVPATMLAKGTPDDVRAYCRALIRDVGERGFFLAAGCDAPVDARPENMLAMVEAGLEYSG